ncbi:S-adenosyl-L-methionine-dependent methyltransferase [Apiospora arundinis]|uniref:S-adenosyl-L-methionine-dependent methyltransferase n=1 Tax=Apiospora arundinis TaxID=335852 RepID=A0ABR2J7R7_9PEZI
MPAHANQGPMEDTARHGGSSGSGSGAPTRKRSIVVNDRRFFSDPTLAYPFPIDLKETHRQTLSTLLRLRLNGGRPVLRSDELVGPTDTSSSSSSSTPSTTPFSTSTTTATRTTAAPSSSQQKQNFKPPRRVLEVGCGSGVWSMLCHRYFARHGHNAVSFVGLDIRGSSSNSSNPSGKSDKEEGDGAGPPALVDSDRDDMYWQFVQHDCRQIPWPLESAAFDLVVFKDMSAAFTQKELAAVTDELVRVLRPGGVLEVWDFDSVLRSLKPNAPDTVTKGRGSSLSISNSSSSTRHQHTQQQQHKKQQQKDDAFAELGVYDVDANILGPSANPFVVEYNGWLSQACDARTVSPVPCATIGPFLVQEADTLEGMISKRFAIPLSTDIGWEKRRQLAGCDGNPTAAANSERAAIRDTALQCVVDLIGTWEPMLRSVNKMSQESWDSWYAKAKKNLMLEGGADGGECLEVGVWSVRKKKSR